MGNYRKFLQKRPPPGLQKLAFRVCFDTLGALWGVHFGACMQVGYFSKASTRLDNILSKQGLRGGGAGVMGWGVEVLGL